jgi:hypothetical protein
MCGKKLKAPTEMHLDHTRPLALLWPVDETATALCGTCNSQKRDRPPNEFYSDEKLNALAQLTGLKFSEIESSEPNHDAIKEIINNLDWLYDTFLLKEELLKERDGKITAELVVKALDKVLERSSKDYNFSFVKEYYNRKNT